jgi:hypothetical protein
MAIGPARGRELAQAIADDLNFATQPWNGLFAAKRSYWTAYALASLDTPSGGGRQVDVTIPWQDWQPESRGQEDGFYQIRVTFQKRIDRTQIALIDAEVDIVTAVAARYVLGQCFINQWSAATNYVIGNWVGIGGPSTPGLALAYFRCILANINQGPPNATYWQQMNPVELVEKHNPVVYSPRQGDMTNDFMSVLDLQFHQWIDP